jgi:prepilin-type N-terminal cleavage/methylation domain-containing protein
LRQRGFTLIELLIVVAIIAVIAAIAIPSLLSARLNTNETAAVATLRTILSAQAQFQSAAAADENNNGIGEYGTFGEMSGGVGVRGGSVYAPAMLSGSFKSVSSDGEVTRSGYVFRVYLPDSSGDGVAEESGGGAAATVDADLAETTWLAYAYPSVHGKTGNRTFCVGNGGDVVWTVEPDYSGPGDADLTPYAALSGGGTAITGSLATGTTGRDSNFWKVVG